VIGIILLYLRAVGVQESQAPVGSIPAPLPRTALVDASGSYWVARADGLMQSTDGRTWRSVGPTAEVAAMATKDGAPWLALGPGTVLVSTDGGGTWAVAGQGRGQAVGGVQEGPDGAYAYFGDAGILRTQDGERWDQVADPLPERVVGFAIAPGSQGGHMFYLAFSNGVARSLDGGRTWSPASGAVSLAVTGTIRGIAADPTRAVVYAATSDGIFRTTRDGNEWERLPFKGGASVVAARGDRMIAIDENGHVFVSKSGGVSWTADS
jgi:hypothetical protein